MVAQAAETKVRSVEGELKALRAELGAQSDRVARAAEDAAARSIQYESSLQDKAEALARLAIYTAALRHSNTNRHSHPRLAIHCRTSTMIQK